MGNTLNIYINSGNTENADNYEVPNYHLGCAYLNGINNLTNNVFEQNYERAQYCLELSAKEGFYAALECLDYMYENSLIINKKFKSASDWFINAENNKNKKNDGNAANQLAYAYLSGDEFISEMNDALKYTLSALPKESRLIRVLEKKEDGYDKGIFWHEIAAETNNRSSFFQLVLHYNFNKENFPAGTDGINKPPSAERIEYYTNKFYPLDETVKKTNYINGNCVTFINRLVELAEIARREGLLALNSIMQKEKNFFIKTGLLMATDGIDSDIIKIVMENLLGKKKKECSHSEECGDLTARKIILEGIKSIQQGENPDSITAKLFDILGDGIETVEKEYAQDNKTSADRARFYYLYGKVYFNKKEWDQSIFYLQKAYEMADNEEDNKYYFSFFIKACEEKQNSLTIEERMAPYTQMIENIKKEPQKQINKIIQFKTKEEATELATALALFEEYDILERFINEAPNSLLPADCSLLNSYVSPQFAYWQPTPFYYISSKKAREKMEDQIKMIKFLASKSADINLAAGDGSTPLWNQTFNDNPIEVLQTLLELGADPNQISINGEHEWTPLVACLTPEFLVNEEEENFTYHIPITDIQIKRAKLLLDNGADPNLESPCLPGYPPLVMAVWYGYPEYYSKHGEEISKDILGFIEYLIKKGADVNYKDSNDNTPLSLAQSNELADVEELLKNNGGKNE